MGKEARAKLRVLQVEDNPGDADLVRTMLAEDRGEAFEITVADCLSGALQLLAERVFDVVLLDLSLPDSNGLDTLIRVQERDLTLPVIVTTGNQDDAMAAKAVQMGAQDYLVKETLSGPLLVRAIRYAIERRQLQARLEGMRDAESQERELQSLELIQHPASTSVTAQLYGSAPLCRASPESFRDLEVGYGDVLEHALEERAFRVHHDLSGELRRLAERLAFLRAGPRDVVEIHAESLKKKTAKASLQKVSAYREEGRLAVLELMGHVAALYRNMSLGTMIMPTKSNNSVKGG